MYSRTETVNAVLKLYQTIIRHPYLDDRALLVPPSSGWGSIHAEGKNETVLDLLCHLPYLHSENEYDQYIIKSETIPICYLGNQDRRDRLLTRPYNPLLPTHCIYLASAETYLGTSLILDTNKGTITALSNFPLRIAVPYEKYIALPEAEKWMAHCTTPIAEFLDSWTQRYDKLVWMLIPNMIGQPVTGRFYSRAASSAEEEELLLQQRQLEPWHVPDPTVSDKKIYEQSEEERFQLQTERERKHAADLFNLYLSHGWLDHFDKERCKAAVMELEKREDAETKRLMDEGNPDAALFD